MMLNFTNLRGESLGTEGDVRSRLYVKPTPKSREPTTNIGIDGLPENGQQYHKGYAVAGRPPGSIKAEQEFVEKRFATWFAMSISDRVAAVQRGDREPKPWDLARYLRTTKPKRVRFKPYELPQAAEECAELARKAGWEYVEILTLAHED